MNDTTDVATRTVLMIEDSPEDRELYRRVLTRAKAHRYTLLEANRVADGLALWRAQRPDCVLLDYQLPDGNGLTALRTIAAEGGADACAIVILTGEGDTQLAVEAMKAGAHDYLNKNRITAETLLHTITNALEKVAAQRLIVAQQQQLTESEAKFSAAFHHSSTAMSIISATEGKYVDVNQACAESLGFSRAAMIGRSPAEFELYADSAQQAKLRELLSRDGYVRNFEVKWRAKSGAVSTHLLSADQITLHGQPCLFVVSNDITDLKRTTAVMQRQAQLINLSYEPIIVWSAADGIIEWNAGAEQLYGYTKAEAVGKTSHDLLQTIHLLPLDQLLAALERGSEWSGEVRHTAKNGRAVIVESRHQSIEFDGRWLVLETNRDITERKEIEAQREQLLREEQRAREIAEAATRAKDEFLAVVSHELRNPLNAILGYARLLRAMPASSIDVAQIKKTVDIIERSGKTQLELINDLLDTARVISGKLKLEVAPLDLSLVINDAIEVMRPAADAKNITLLHQFEPGLGPIIGDQQRLQQVILNLINNAVKFTPNGGLIHVLLRRAEKALAIQVRDNGKGISPAFLPHLFGRFTQADASESRRQGGLGLGLALVKQLVELHGGEIAVASEGEGKGASFTVKLPVQATVPILPQEVITSHELSESDHKLLAGVSILVIDDELEARELVTSLLATYGATVASGASAAEGFALLTDQANDKQFSVLISDIGMPDEDGYSLLRRFRAWERSRGQRLPAIALTSFRRTEDRMAALMAGFETHVPKPVEVEELVAVINSLLGRFEQISA